MAITTPPEFSRSGSLEPPAEPSPSPVAALAEAPDTSAYDLMDQSFDRLTRLVTTVLSVPMVLISLFEENRQFFRSKVGLPAPFASPNEVPTAFALVVETVSHGEVVMVADATTESELIGVDVGGGGVGAVSYMGIPLLSGDQRVIGTLCVIDIVPRIWKDEEAALLRDLAASLITEIELRRDVAVRQEAERKLLHNALHDALTGLPNRVLFMERLRHAINRARRHPDFIFAVLFLDLDRFKLVNDSLGHHVGDQLLAAVARRLERCLRDEDTVARLGGDEFAILLESIEEPSAASRVAERIQVELAMPINLDGYEVFTSASIGIVLSSSTGELPEFLLRSADMAMYRAKSGGRARYDMFDRAMHADALARLQVETDLRRALEHEELRLHYQPVISLATGKIVGVEALVRWEHPERGLIQPGEFIPIAEETGLIVPLGRWTLVEACRQVRKWQEQFQRLNSLSVSVNLSVKQFSQVDLLEQIGAIISESKLGADCLRLEITESTLIGHVKYATSMLDELKKLGIRVYMDDFGTGYSSLSYLLQLPIDAIKIDRTFVSQMEAADAEADAAADGAGEDAADAVDAVDLAFRDVDAAFATDDGIPMGGGLAPTPPAGQPIVPPPGVLPAPLARRERTHYQLVKTIVTLARSVGVRAVAEGVVTAEQLRILRALGCEYAQGYLFSAPMSPDALEDLLRVDPAW